MKGVHKRVKKYRKLIGLTQSELAEVLNITTQAYALKERGLRRFNPDEMMAIKILVSQIEPGVTVDEIFFASE